MDGLFWALAATGIIDGLVWAYLWRSGRKSIARVTSLAYMLCMTIVGVALDYSIVIGLVSIIIFSVPTTLIVSFVIDGWGTDKLQRKLTEYSEILGEKVLGSDTMLLRRAEKRADALCAIVPEEPWTDVRIRIRQLACDDLRDLLERRRILRRQIGEIRQLIERDQTLDSPATLGYSRTHLTTLMRSLTSVENQVEAIRVKLDHLAAELHVARENDRTAKHVENGIVALHDDIASTRQSVSAAEGSVKQHLAQANKRSAT